MKRAEDPSYFPHSRTAHLPPIPPFQSDYGHFMGFPMSQSRLAVPSWSYFFEHVPAARIIELGTNCGGFSICLGIMGKQWGFHVTTFDLGENPKDSTLIPGWFDFLGIQFYRADVLSEPTIHQISEMIKLPGVTVLACDNGNKIKEWQIYSKFLKPGDCILAHDLHPDCYPYEGLWGWGEIRVEDVKDIILENDLWPYLYDEMAYGAWLSYRRGKEWTKQ